MVGVVESVGDAKSTVGGPNTCGDPTPTKNVEAEPNGFRFHILQRYLRSFLCWNNYFPTTASTVIRSIKPIIDAVTESHSSLLSKK